jgi:hypothetical protein
MSQVDLYPRRYLVTGFPNSAELEQLGKELG